MPSQATHRPVLLEETVSRWFTKPDGIYVDGTFGRGGHSLRLLEQLSPKGQLLVIDRDPEAIATAKVLQKKYSQIQIEQGDFASMDSHIKARGWLGKVTGILLDLGISSPQLDTAERGFSFMQHGPLDMRMDPDQGVSAADWLAEATWQEIATVLSRYGEEKFAKRIAKAIERVCETEKISTTTHLVNVIEAAVPARDQGKHKATRTFQAIRIHINRELEQVENFLQGCLELLAPQGRLAIISFHSLEDRIVKRYMRDQIKGDKVPAYIPIRFDQLKTHMKQIVKAQKASAQEIAENPRSRSAILRVAEKH